MGESGIRDIDITTLIAASAILIIFLVQSLLCFKVKSLLLRLLPSLLLTVTTILFFIMSQVTTDWDAVGYAVLFIFSGLLLIVSGIAWGVWALIKLTRKEKSH